MAAVNAKATIFFDSTDSEGWSEKFYLTGADLTTIRGFLDTILPLRLAMLHTSFRAVYARVSDVAVKGDSLLTTVALPAFGTYTPAAGITQLEANTAILAELFASPLIKNRMFLRGLSSDVVNGREYTGITGWETAFTAWGGGLIANGCVARHRTAIGPPPTYSYTTITTVSTVKATARKPGRPFGLPVGRR